MWKEFKEFAIRGSVIDLAVGVIIGAAFGKIVTSFVDDLINPVVGLITGKVPFADKFVALDGNDYATLDAAKAANAPTLNYGLFINTVLTFLITAFAIFLLIKFMNRIHRQQAAEAPAPSQEELLLTEIRDLLKQKS